MQEIITQARKDNGGIFLLFPEDQKVLPMLGNCVGCWEPYQGHSMASIPFLTKHSIPMDMTQAASLISAYEHEYHCKLVHDNKAMQKLKRYKA
jgi:hypothetical protein